MKRGRGAADDAKVVVAVENPENKPRFAVMHMVLGVSGKEVESLWFGSVWLKKWWSKLTVGKGVVPWMPCPTVMIGSFPVREGVKIAAMD